MLGNCRSVEDAVDDDESCLVKFGKLATCSSEVDGSTGIASFRLDDGKSGRGLAGVPDWVPFGKPYCEPDAAAWCKATGLFDGSTLSGAPLAALPAEVPDDSIGAEFEVALLCPSI